MGAIARFYESIVTKSRIKFNIIHIILGEE